MKTYTTSATYERYTNHDEDMAHAEGLIRSLLTVATILAVGFLIMVGCYQTTADQLRDVTAQRDWLNAAILATAKRDHNSVDESTIEQTGDYHDHNNSADARRTARETPRRDFPNRKLRRHYR